MRIIMTTLTLWFIMFSIFVSACILAFALGGMIYYKVGKQEGIKITKGIRSDYI